MAEPSMYWIDINTGIARMEAKTDNFLVIAKDEATLKKLAQRMINAWQVTVTTLLQEEALEKCTRKNKKLRKILDIFKNSDKVISPRDIVVKNDGTKRGKHYDGGNGKRRNYYNSKCRGKK